MSRFKVYTHELRIVIPAVNSPSRAFNGVVETPILFSARRRCLCLWNEDKQRYGRLCRSWSNDPRSLLHPRSIRMRLGSSLDYGFSFGAPTESPDPLRLRKSVNLVPLYGYGAANGELRSRSHYEVRFALGSSYTGWLKIVNFEGCYNDIQTHYLVKAVQVLDTGQMPILMGLFRQLTCAKHTNYFANIMISKKWKACFLRLAIRCLHYSDPVAANELPFANNGFLQNLGRQVCEIGVFWF